MEYKYYHHSDLKQIIKIVVAKKFEQAKVELDAYVEKYPNDFRAYPYYIDLLIKLNELNLAEEKLSIMETLVNKRIDSILKIEMVKRLKIKLLSFSGRYEECYTLLKENQTLLFNVDIAYQELLFFLEDRLGLRDLNYTSDSYLHKQIIDYSDERFLEHVGKHQYGSCLEAGSSIFAEDFPLKEIHFKLKEMLPLDELKRNNGLIDNFYTFRYDYCGRCDGKLVNYFRLVTLNGSNQFITMYPYENDENCRYLDLNYMRVEKVESPKVKRMSQIEKFNQRYGKKVDNN